VALCTLADAFPASRFEGFDPSHHAIDRARARVGTSGLSNVDLHVVGAEGLPSDGRYALVMTLDCIHDMPRPGQAIAAIRRAIQPEGTWLIKDIRSGPNWPDNVKNPVLALMYGTSVACCMSSALSEQGGAGLGTLGFHPDLAERMCRDAGFTRFRIHDVEDPANLYYEVRP
jgi:ubiquinone/menaquinone biosynthesis C-methylase UbiE